MIGNCEKTEMRKFPPIPFWFTPLVFLKNQSPPTAPPSNSFGNFIVPSEKGGAGGEHYAVWI